MFIKKIFLLALLGSILLACQQSIPRKEIDVPIDPHASEEDFIQLAWFYKPPEDGTSLAVLAQKFDTFILTHYDEDERDELRQLGVDNPVLEYLLFVQIQDPGSCNKTPYGNQVAYKVGDFCSLSIEHPDWFLRDENGEMIRKGKNVYMDPDNSGYREFWLERAEELQNLYGWEGLFIDNVEASLNKFKRIGKLPAKYPDDESYQIAMEGFLAYIDENIQYRPVYANIVECEDNSLWLGYLSFLDGAMIEDFAVGYNERYYLPVDWEKQLLMVVEAQKMKKPLILISQGQKNDLDREKFSFASYLLVSGGNLSFRYADSDFYGDAWFYENYFFPLGVPTSGYYEFEGGWRRDFTKGYVYVNPVLHESEIEVWQ